MAGEASDQEHAAHPSKLTDTFIVPKVPAGSVKQPLANRKHTLFEQNWAFARQWRDHKPDERDVVELEVDPTDAQLFDAFNAAAGKAAGHDVILFVGHGAGGDHAVFDLAPESKGFSTHKHLIDRDVLNLTDFAERDASGAWKAKAQGGLKADTALEAKVAKLGPRRDLLERIGKAFKASGVKTFIVLSCSLGIEQVQRGEKRTHQLLANVLGATVTVFKGKIATDQSLIEPNAALAVQLWVATNPDDPDSTRPKSNNKTKSGLELFPAAHFSFCELPSIERASAGPGF